MATKKTQPKTADTPVVQTTVILKRPLITEKAARYSAQSVYVFDVALEATKSEIAKAFKAQFKHAPIKVNLVNLPRKSYFRRGKLGFGPYTKKAYVYLAKGTTIEVM